MEALIDANSGGTVTLEGVYQLWEAKNLSDFPWNSCIKGKNHADTHNTHTYCVLIHHGQKYSLPIKYSFRQAAEWFSVCSSHVRWLAGGGRSESGVIRPEESAGSSDLQEGGGMDGDMLVLLSMSGVPGETDPLSFICLCSSPSSSLASFCPFTPFSHSHTAFRLQSDTDDNFLYLVSVVSFQESRG